MSVRNLTITLTGAQSVQIDRLLWPIVASASDSHGAASERIIVRQRAADGQAVVYGIALADGCRDRRGGEWLVEPARNSDHIIAAIRRVAASLGFSPEIANRCIATLPARNLDAKEIA